MLVSRGDAGLGHGWAIWPLCLSFPLCTRWGESPAQGALHFGKGPPVPGGTPSKALRADIPDWACPLA